MKLFIIQPSHYLSPSDLRIYKTKKRRLVGLTLPYLASLTPGEWDITLIDEQVMDIDFKGPADVVAITSWTINSLRAYDIADEFRGRGVKVIMGGPHAYFHAEEAAAHADAVGIGEADQTWHLMLEDAARGRLKKTYASGKQLVLDNLPHPRYDLIDFKRYRAIKTFSVQTSRGCPFSCEFCSERFYLGKGYRFRPVRDVVEEIRRIKAKYFLFADSNFAGNPDHTMELMEALIPLKIHWSTLWPAYLCKSRKFMDLAKKSGVLHVNIGIESIDQETLAGMNKRMNKVREYKEILQNLRKRNISYSLNFIFGWETQKEDAFRSTMEFLMEEKVPAAFFDILTPIKGTPLYESMKAEDKILNTKAIGRWPGIMCHIKPNHFSAQELEERVKKMYEDFYSYTSMVKRLPLPVTRSNIASWSVNLEQRNVRYENFDAY